MMVCKQRWMSLWVCMGLLIPQVGFAGDHVAMSPDAMREGRLTGIKADDTVDAEAIDRGARQTVGVWLDGCLPEALVAGDKAIAVTVKGELVDGVLVKPKVSTPDLREEALRLITCLNEQPLAFEPGVGSGNVTLELSVFRYAVVSSVLGTGGDSGSLNDVFMEGVDGSALEGLEGIAPAGGTQTVDAAVLEPVAVFELATVANADSDLNAVHQVLAKRRSQLIKCWKRVLQKSDAVGGRLTVTLTVGTDGRVTHITSVHDLDEELGACVEAKMKRWKFGELTAETTVEVPIVFAKE